MSNFTPSTRSSSACRCTTARNTCYNVEAAPKLEMQSAPKDDDTPPGKPPFPGSCTSRRPANATPLALLVGVLVVAGAGLAVLLVARRRRGRR